MNKKQIIGAIHAMHRAVETKPAGKCDSRANFGFKTKIFHDKILIYQEFFPSTDSLDHGSTLFLVSQILQQNHFLLQLPEQSARRER